MAEKIVSPGVFTNEIDQSFLPAGIAAIGAADIGIVEADELNSIHSQLGLDQPVKIIAGLPLLRPPDSIPTAFILGTQLPDKTTQDRFVTYDEKQRIIDLAAVAEENLPSDRSVLGICTLIG